MENKTINHDPLINIQYQNGLIPAIVQDIQTKEVLMLAYMNAESLQKTLESGETWFWSRSRQELWHKGRTSGNTQKVIEIRYDCDGDTLLVLVEPAGPACHTGNKTCFYRILPPSPLRGEEIPGAFMEINELSKIILDRKNNPKPGSYTNSLFDAGMPRIAQKVGEEGTEVVVAALSQNNDRLVEEIADLTYHVLMLMAAKGIMPEDVAEELERRHK
jgi:phosphoribosyl-ATP pyrophosphohydrolase/phosphoribosyl-AMP cyclohydrolase